MPIRNSRDPQRTPNPERTGRGGSSPGAGTNDRHGTRLRRSRVDLARRRVRCGLDITLLGEPGRVSAARTLRPGRRYVRMSTPTLAYEARTHFPGYVVRDGNGIERARYDGAFWEFEEPDPATVAFASFFIAAALEPFMTSPLLEIF